MKKIIAIISILMLIAVPVCSIAATEAEIREQQKDLQNKVNEAKDKIEDIKGNVSATMKELDLINDEIEQKQAEIEKTTEELNNLNKEVSQLTTQLNEAQQKYDSQYEAFCKRIVANYKNGSVSYLDVLLNSNTLTEFISNYYMIGKIAEYDTKLLDDIEKQKKTIEDSKTEREKKKAEVADKQTKLKLDETILTNKKVSKNKYISQLNDEEKSLQQQIEDYNQNIRNNDAQLAEIARQAAQSNGGGHVYTGGQLQWPCPNYKYISSYFGYRGSAATGGVGTANHNGYDLAAPHYADILAADTGTVIKVVSGCKHDYPKTFKTRCNCGGGYGNYVMINHGGITTLYGHCASVNVSVGQTVSRGQKIASVGSAGWSTGYHLHFSVLNSNGKYIDPGPYLGK